MRTVIIAVSAYISLMIFSNLGSLRILGIAGLAVDGGTLLYPLSFTMRDVLHKKLGQKLTVLTVWLCAGVNLLMFLFVWLVSVLPAHPDAGAQTEYAQVLAPGIRLVLASIAGMTVSELIDTLVYGKARQRWGEKKQWLRVVLSNGVSVPIDTAIFLLIAFAGRYPVSVIISMFFANIIIKYAVSLASVWSVYLVREDRA